MSEERTQLKELVEEHLSRRSHKDAGLVGLITGLATIGEVLAATERGTAHWGALVLRLREAIASTKAALKQTRGDAGLIGLEAFADRELAFATVLEDEIVRLEEGESTLV